MKNDSYILVVRTDEVGGSRTLRFGVDTLGDISRHCKAMDVEFGGRYSATVEKGGSLFAEVVNGNLRSVKVGISYLGEIG